MSVPSLVIKKEPEEQCPAHPEDLPTNSESIPIQTEFVNIKMELDTVTANVRVKEEPLPQIQPSSPQEPDTTLPETQSPYNHSEQQHWHSSHPNIWPTLPYQAEPRKDAWPSLLVEKPESWHRPVQIRPIDVSVQSVPIEFEKNNDLDDSQFPSKKRAKRGPNNAPKDNPNWTCTPDGKFACTLCPKKYSTNGNFQRHFLVHSLGSLECQQCAKPFTTLGQLQRHIKVHGTYDCDECGKVFKTSSNLFQHKRVHMPEKPFKCPLCGKDFTVKANLMKHQGKSRCKRYTGPITCHVCHKEFKTHFLLKSHLRRHTTEKPFSCDLCDMNFKYKSTLIRHIQIHNGIRPYSCEVCNKSFTHVSLLKPHMRIHTGEKPYPCPICAKMFAHKHNMERHTLRHSREKKTICEICNKKFPKESRLKYHMRTHIDEKHFCCFICPKKFSHRQNVLRHYTRKHPNATYDGTDTDAKIATKLWEEVLNNKIKLTNKDEAKDNKVKNEIVAESEEILPDINRSVTVEQTVVKKNKLTDIVAALNKKIAGKSNDRGDENVSIKQEAFDSDSDDEVLAKKVERVRNVTNGNETGSNEKVVASNENVRNNALITESNEKVVASNESMVDGNKFITESNIQIVVKKEVISDEEEILPDKVDNVDIVDNLLPSVEIKMEVESVVDS